MDVVSDIFHTVREQLFVHSHYAVFSASVPIAVIDVYVLEADFAQAFSYHSVGLGDNFFFVDVAAVSVPRTPSHRGR